MEKKQIEEKLKGLEEKFNKVKSQKEQFEAQTKQAEEELLRIQGEARVYNGMLKELEKPESPKEVKKEVKK